MARNLVIAKSGANYMVTAEERYKLIMTLCESTQQTAGLVAAQCDVLLAESNHLFNEAQKAEIKYIQESAQKLSPLVDEINQANAIGI